LKDSAMANGQGKTIQALQGSGEVLFHGEPVASVEYSLREEQGTFVSETFGGSISVPGFRTISGSIVLLSGAIPADRQLVLQLADGRELDFVARDPNYYRKSYRLVAASEVRDPR